MCRNFTQKKNKNAKTTYVHGNTTNFGPAVALGLVLVVSPTSFQHGLVNSATSGHNANHGTAVRRDHLLRARRQLDSGPVGVRIVGNDGGIVARRPSEAASVTALLLKVAHDSAFGHRVDGEDVTDLKEERI